MSNELAERIMDLKEEKQKLENQVSEKKGQLQSLREEIDNMIEADIGDMSDQEVIDFLTKEKKEIDYKLETMRTALEHKITSIEKQLGEI